MDQLIIDMRASRDVRDMRNLGLRSTFFRPSPFVLYSSFSVLRPFFLIVALFVNALASAAIIETVAGTGRPENNGDDGRLMELNIGDPFGVEIGPDRSLYVTEVRNHRVRRIDLERGEIETVAGTGRRGYRGDGGLATEAEMNEPYEVRFDQEGNLYVVEMKNHLVRRIDRVTKTISTIAGTGEQGFAGDGGPAIEAKFNQPHSIALDRHGNIYIADIGNHRIRRFDIQSRRIDTFAGSRQRRLPTDGQPVTANAVLGPRALFIAGDTMWVALREGHSVWRIDLREAVWHHIAGTGSRGFSGDGGPALSATFNGPKGIAVGPRGHVYVVDTENQVIRQIDLNRGTIETIAGSGPEHAGFGGDHRAATIAKLARPHGICVGHDGTVFIGDTLNHRVRRVR